MLALVVAPDLYLAHTLAVTVQTLTDAQVLPAHSGAEARALLARRRPDLVVAAGWLPAGELVRLMADAGTLAPGGLRVVLEAPADACEVLLALGVDVVLEEGAPAGRLIDALAQLLLGRAAGMNGRESGNG